MEPVDGPAEIGVYGDMEARTRLPRPMWVFILTQCAVTGACLLTEFVCALLRMPVMYRDPFFVGLRFFDFESFQQRFHSLHQTAFFALDKMYLFNYPAPAAAIYAAFFSAGWDRALNVYLGFLTASLVVLGALFARSLHRRGLAAEWAAGYASWVCALAFPFWFLFERANIELVMWLFVAAGLYAFLARRGYPAAACFGVAASIKLVPVVYLFLLLPRRQWRQFCFGLAVMGAVTWWALWWMGPTVVAAWHGIATGMSNFSATVAPNAKSLQPEKLLGLNPTLLGWDHSVIALLHRYGLLTGGLGWYMGVSAIVGLALYCLRIVRLPAINQVLCLAVATIWLPPVSYEYTLIALYGVFAILAAASTQWNEAQQRRAIPLFVMLAILCSPLGEIIWHGVQYGGQLKCLLLGAAFLFGLVRPMASLYDTKSNELSDV